MKCEMCSCETSVKRSTKRFCSVRCRKAMHRYTLSVTLGVKRGNKPRLSVTLAKVSVTLDQTRKVETLTPLVADYRTAYQELVQYERA